MTGRCALARRAAAGAAAGTLALGLLVACSGDDPAAANGPVPATRTATGGAAGDARATGPVDDPTATVRLVAVGDVAGTRTSSRPVAELTERIDPDLLLVLGDVAYPNGTYKELRRKYHPWWGDLRPITRPVPGNHDYRTRGARGYFRYFEKQVRGRRWYAFDAGAWRVYALSCEVACGRKSRQHRWLRKQLRKHGDKPSAAMMHRPRLTCSPAHPPSRRARPMFRTLRDAGTSLFLSGHVHAYERFAPRPLGAEHGLRQVVVGTGGARFYPTGADCSRREKDVQGVNGVLELTLAPDSYAWRFVSVDDEVLDEGAETLPAS